MRAWESARPDRLFEDPLAAEFVAAAGWERPRMDDVPPEARAALGRMASWVSARTRFLDDLLLDATAGGVRQVVLLGAGLDARAFRLDWPDGVRLFELGRRRCWASSSACWPRPARGRAASGS
jgi:methyltransferase (TIGR00027 family)